MKRKQQYGSVTNVTKMLSDRSYWDVESILRNRLRAAPQFVDFIDLETELKGHNGCVNCLQWSDDGHILASASDDLHVKLWDPFRHTQLHDILTPHEGNIFSVKFLPQRGNSVLATCAGDCKTFVFDINRQTENPTRRCVCHLHRVKRLATSPRNPHLFWSAAEDGLVLQHDMRVQHACNQQDNNVLIDLRNYLWVSPEVKCIAINPQRPEQMAIGANDCYARVYDRRMISLSRLYDPREIGDGLVVTTRIDKIPNDGCVKYFCPGHLNGDEKVNMQYNFKTITYLTFSPDGTELLVNMGSDHIYLFEINGSRQPVFLELPKLPPTTNGETNGCVGGEKTKHKFPPDVEQLKMEGNDNQERSQYLQAINKYTQAIRKANNKDCSILYLNRATALMRRDWYGDAYAAVRDCHTALRLDPHYVKAYFRLARALLKLEQSKEAQLCLDELIKRFPSYAKNQGVLLLGKDIGIELDKQRVRASESRFSIYEGNYFHDKEKGWRAKATDYEKRFVGHCNTKTDIKEANYFGDSNYIVAGSDDGRFYVWDRHSGLVTASYKADELIVNCVQPHPYVCLLATSGIDNEIRLWTPKSPEGKFERKEKHLDACVSENQTRMKADPFEEMTPGQAICRAS
ncbi:WD and tetratricopeptide repeats protein 1-like [Anopheles ziemanni]|uniref:WD and tetratricopeptide repeats protein 1-like n=1 Tax=Anopheles ziemanni TaxID=345580 RepID=UPI00265B3D2E|nr:WD and tetratricopeptide repeats protein 1-like isoform X2 [Anopheles coustani]XP_058171716.1 WD and tetratricopeptide repeats protein 1-like [Anopheles ziemanni]